MAMISRLVAVSFFLLSLLSFCCVLFLVVAVSFFFFLLKTAYEIGVRLVGSVLCIRDRYLQQAHAIDSAGGAGNGDDQSFGGCLFFSSVFAVVLLCVVLGGCCFFFFFLAEDGIRDWSPSRGLGVVYKRQVLAAGARHRQRRWRR